MFLHNIKNTIYNTFQCLKNLFEIMYENLQERVRTLEAENDRLKMAAIAKTQTTTRTNNTTTSPSQVKQLDMYSNKKNYNYDSTNFVETKINQTVYP